MSTQAVQAVIGRAVTRADDGSQAQDRTRSAQEALASARHIDLQALQPSINRMAKAK